MASHSRGTRPNPARELVDLAQDGRGWDAYAVAALEVLGRHIGTDSGIFVGTEKNRLDARWRFDDRRGRYADRGIELVESRYAPEARTAWAAVQAQGGGLDHEIYSATERRDLALYREVIRPAGMRSLLLLCARWQGRPLVWIYLARHGPQAFRRTHLERALTLLPTVEASLVAMRSSDELEFTLDGLTAREQEVALHVARGLTTPQVALVLGTSRHTVRNQMVRIFDKLGVSSRAELASLVATCRARATRGS